MAETIAEAIWKEGWTQGLSQGLSQGALNASRRMLQEFLAGRFGPLPEDIVQRIENCNDLDRLTAAVEQILRLDKPEDLQL
jgi:hypothetical protein